MHIKKSGGAVFSGKVVNLCVFLIGGCKIAYLFVITSYSIHYTKLYDAVIPESEIVILQTVQPHENHNGGKLAFGPDGYLYISFGDGGGSGDRNNFV